MDEPCSALDPIATLKIEDLMRELAQQYTIIIVTHNMQQAARVSDYTAFFNMARGPRRLPGRVRRHERLVHQSEEQAYRRLHHRPVRMIAPDSPCQRGGK